MLVKLNLLKSEYVYHELTTKCDAQGFFMLQNSPILFYGKLLTLSRFSVVGFVG